MAAGEIFLPRPHEEYQNSLNLLVEEIYQLIRSAKHNKQTFAQFLKLVNQIIQALSGADANFLRNAEFYQDLLETLNKIKNHLVALSKRKIVARFLMSKKDDQILNDMQKHVDTLCGRIFLSYAQRFEKRMVQINQSMNVI